MFLNKKSLFLSISVFTFVSSSYALDRSEKKFIEDYITKSIQVDVMLMRDKNLVSRKDLEELGNIKPEKQADALVDLLSDAIDAGDIMKAPPPKPKISEPVKKTITTTPKRVVVEEPERVVRRYIDESDERVIIEREDSPGRIIRDLANTASALIARGMDKDRDERRRERWKDYDRRNKDIVVHIDVDKDDKDKGDKKKVLTNEPISEKKTTGGPDKAGGTEKTEKEDNSKKLLPEKPAAEPAKDTSVVKPEPKAMPEDKSVKTIEPTKPAETAVATPEVKPDIKPEIKPEDVKKTIDPANTGMKETVADLPKDVTEKTGEIVVPKPMMAPKNVTVNP